MLLLIYPTRLRTDHDNRLLRESHEERIAPYGVLMASVDE